ncbi:hypothetical protein M0Q50_02255 [bacterium]|jgi:hypothetical protein|nr:hypothetical protein [bacterium]
MKKLLYFNESLKDVVPELTNLHNELKVATKRIYDICLENIEELNFESMEIMFDLIFRQEKLIYSNDKHYFSFNKRRKILEINHDWYHNIAFEIRGNQLYPDDTYINKDIKKIFKEKYNMYINVIVAL